MKLKITPQQIRTFHRLQRKYQVSLEFILRNIHNVLRFMRYAITPHMIVKHVALRRRKKRVVLNYWHLRRFVIDPKYKKIIHKRRENVKQWSKQMVLYLKIKNGPAVEYYEDTYEKGQNASSMDANEPIVLPPEEVSKQMKQQLKLLKDRKRSAPLINGQATFAIPLSADADVPKFNNMEHPEMRAADSLNVSDDADNSSGEVVLIDDSSTNTKCSSANSSEKPSGSFLDMLMSKVKSNGETELGNSKMALMQRMPCSPPTTRNGLSEVETDSCEEFLGFEDAERIPGLNSAFVSETLNAYMRENSLEGMGKHNLDVQERKKTLPDGVVAPGCIPPKMEMPIIPESLQRLRTVAERRQFLLKTKNHKYAIIHTGATVYRELQREIRQQSVNRNSILLLQSANMPFSRDSWSAAAFLLTDTNRYYFQEIIVDGDVKPIKLYGVLGNNEQQMKKPYNSRLPPSAYNARSRSHCSLDCLDLLTLRALKPIKTHINKVKLNSTPLRPLFKPCPLSMKPFQKPLDKETAELLLDSDGMTVVRMPQIELEVFPQLAKPLHEVAKRYLQLVLPHNAISREWAEFSVSTLHTRAQLEHFKEKQQSFTFPIPYLNDRNHVLVRKVVDRSEKLDVSFENNRTADLAFRQNIDEDDPLSVECGDIITEMINSVAISCSENTFTREDPSGNDCDGAADRNQEVAVGSDGKKVTSAAALPQNKKQNRLLSELRRLNATVIDAAVRSDKVSGDCKKDYCALGCVCSSISEDRPVRQHCGKIKCMLSCTCKGAPSVKNYMRWETDGHTLTTEDAFMLRRQATARLARMEKEFTSTIVLTGNEPLLINESQYDKKRRCTKAPKRYGDFIESEESNNLHNKLSPGRRQSAAVISPTSELPEYNDRPLSSAALSDVSGGISCETIFAEDWIVDSVKHCTVSLVRFDELENMVTWCMVHQLYKCFCGGRALDGKVITIETEGQNITTPHGGSNSSKQEEYATKAHYSFEKEEMHLPRECDIEKASASCKQQETYSQMKINAKNDGNDNSEEEDQAYTADESDTTSIDDTAADPDVSPLFKQHQSKKLNSDNRVERRGRIKDEVILQSYFDANAEECRRVVAIPNRMYQRRNRKRALDVNAYIQQNESVKTRRMLNEHLIRSVYFHKDDVEKKSPQKHDQQQQQKHQEGKVKHANEKSDVPQLRPQEEKLDNEIQKKKEDEAAVATAKDNERTIKRLSRNERQRERRKRRRLEQQQTLLVEEDAVDSGVNSMESGAPTSAKRRKSTSGDSSIKSTSGQSLLGQRIDTPSPPTASLSTGSSVEQQMPTIASCYSLHDAAESNTNFRQENDLTEMSSITVQPQFSTADGGGLDSTEQSDVLSGSRTAQQTAATTTTTISADEQNAINRAAVKEIYNTVIKNMNNLVSKKMQDIDLALRRESKVVPTPSKEILCIIKWSNFLDAFLEGYVYIWEVKMQNTRNNFLAATITNMMPMVMNAVGVVIITAVDRHQLPLLGRMLLDRCCMKSTDKLAIVMQGQQMYWVVKGFLRQERSRACAKPTPHTHPLLTEKINILCRLLVNQQIKDNQRAANLAALSKASSLNVAASSAFSANIAASSASSANIAASDAPSQHAKVLATTQQSRKISSKQNRTSQLGSNSAKGPAILKDLIQRNFSQMNTNIEFRKATRKDVAEIHRPDKHSEDHRWLVLDLYNDFSHIYLPDFQDLVSLDRIHKVMAYAEHRKKIVKLQFFLDAPFDAFVTPYSNRKIYFGPLRFNMRPPLLLLLQSVDGNMMLREVYQLEHNITPTNKRTMALWVLQINGKLHFSMDETEMATSLHPNALTDSSVAVAVVGDSTADEDDDDCMIVDDEPAKSISSPSAVVPPVAAHPTTVRPNQQQENSKQSFVSANPVLFSIMTNPKSAGVPVLSSALPLSTDLDCPTLSPAASPSTAIVTPTLTRPERTESPGVLVGTITPNNPSDLRPRSPQVTRMNFTISTSSESASLMVTPHPSNTQQTAEIQNNLVTVLTPEPSASLGQTSYHPAPTSRPQCQVQPTTSDVPFIPLLKLPVIASVAAPIDAPYGSTLFISNVKSTSTFPTSAIDTATSYSTTSLLPTANIPPRFAQVPLSVVQNFESRNVVPKITSLSTDLPLLQATSSTSMPPTTAVKPMTVMTPPTVPLVYSAVTPLPIKRRRMSVICSTELQKTCNLPATYSLLRQNALQKQQTPPTIGTLLGNVANASTTPVKVAKLTTTKPQLIMSKPPTQSHEISSIGSTNKLPSKAVADGHVQSIGNTTITKIQDGGDPKMEAVAKPNNSTPTILQPFMVTTGEPPKPTLVTTSTTRSNTIINSLGIMPSSISEPLVFNVNFIDNCDEPSASIVIKPTAQIFSSASTSVPVSDGPGPNKNASPASDTNCVTAATSNNKLLSGIFKRPIISTTQAKVSGKTCTPPSLGTLMQANIKPKPAAKIAKILPNNTNMANTVSRVQPINVPMKKPIILPESYSDNLSSQMGVARLPAASPVRLVAPSSSSSLSTEPKSLIQRNNLTSSKTVVSSASASASATQLPILKQNVKPQQNVSKATTIITIPHKTVVKLRKSKNATDPLSVLDKTTTPAGQQQKIRTSDPIQSGTTGPTGGGLPLSTTTTTIATSAVVTSTRTVQRFVTISGSGSTASVVGSSFITPPSIAAKQLPNGCYKYKLIRKPIASTITGTGPSVKNATSTPNPAPNYQYGCFVSNVPGLPKFIARRMKDDYLVKVPGFKEVVRLKGLTAVHCYLNDRIKKNFSHIVSPDKLPLRWKFFIQDRSLAVASSTTATGYKSTSKRPLESNVAAPQEPSVSSTSNLKAAANILNVDPILIED